MKSGEVERGSGKSVQFQGRLFSDHPKVATRDVEPFPTQFLKWIGSKQRVAHRIISYFPHEVRDYYEPFLGSGAVLGTLVPHRAVASDVLPPLIEIWQALKETPDQLVSWYTERWKRFQAGRELAYEEIKATYNRHPNAADLLFLSRSCYGGVIRFRRDGYMSTPIGIHDPISPDSFTQRVGTWRKRVAGARFECCDFEDTIERAGPADVVYCDPPYSDTQSILYGAQAFSLERLLAAIRRAKGRGVFVALSIDGKKKSGKKICDVPIPDDLFEHSVFVASSSSMLKRFQMEGETSESELVADRLLLTW